MNFGPRPLAIQGNATEEELFVAVGKALSCWELVEQGVASLFTIVTVGSYYAPTAPALRAYASVIGSRARIDMVTAALKSWLNDWPDCPCGQNALEALKNCKSWASRRNEVAHGLVDKHFEQESWFLMPSLYSIKGRPLPKAKAAYRYNAEIIESFAVKFIELHHEINAATSMLGEWHRIAASETERMRQSPHA